MLILTERTPNPEALKFITPEPLVAGDGWAFERAGFEAAQSPLASRIFAVAGVARVFVGPDFLTVSRAPHAGAWSELKYQVIAAIADHLESGEPAVAATAAPGPVDELAEEIRQVLGRHVRPGVARDGGDVIFHRFDPDAGVLWIRMQGACGGCPSARSTLKANIEVVVRRYVPEVLRVEEVDAGAGPEPAGARLRRWAQALGGSGGARPRTVFTHSDRRFRD